MYTEIKIRILKKDERGYPVEINSQGQVFEGYLDSAVLPWVGTASPIEDGARLFAHLFADDTLKKAWSQICGQAPERRVRLRIDVDAPELHAIPWEQLQDGTTEPPQIIAADEATPFSRDLAVSHPFGEPLTNRPIKMLVMIATPENLPDYKLQPLDWETERAVIDSIWLQSPNPAELQITTLNEPATLSALETALGDGYQLLHIVAHGKKGEHSNKSVLYLANEDNQVDFVSVSDLTTMLGRQTNLPRFIFLVACQTATRSPADAFRGFAPQLIQTGIPAVLAMQDLVPVKTARQFTQTFYQQLFQHGLVDLAANKARSILMTKGLPGSAIPVLFSRMSGNLLIGGKLPLIQDRSQIELESPLGIMQPDSPYYLERSADERCWRYIEQPDNTIAIQSARQTGKSSLMRRMLYRAKKELDKPAVFIDFQNFGTEFESEEEFFKLFCEEICEQLNLRPTVDKHWRKRGPQKRRCTDYLAKYILPQHCPFILALDEVDLMMSTDFVTEFFSMLRVWHNKKASEANFKKMSLFLSISTDPYTMIDDVHQSPFNVAQDVFLLDFTMAELTVLVERYQLSLPDVDLQTIFELTSGHPFLTNMAFYQLATGLDKETLYQQAASDKGPFASHLHHYYRFINQQSEFIPVIQAICRYGNHDLKSAQVDQLIQKGLLKISQKRAVFHNQIYARYLKDKFDDQ
ncbi:AAA-like domain-containing protein [Anaerolineales bacterium HSG25]|nr:AAA-like domain-containing protein [Anaerolineales bacterium HSG25]